MMKPHFFSDQSKLRKWFEQNHNKKEELLLGYYKKRSGNPSVTWEESVDEALCFGWIDGIRKSIDEISYTIRFTPRKINSVWSAKNVKRVEELINLKLMKAPGLEVYGKRKDKTGYDFSYGNSIIDFNREFEKIFKGNKKAWKFFNAQISSYRKPAIRWVMSAKQEKTKQQRLNTLIKCSEAGEIIPHMRWGNIKVKKTGKD
jgi:uncharacterized protein YdeI (YjbR/CyaY-like superfamily)